MLCHAVPCCAMVQGALPRPIGDRSFTAAPATIGVGDFWRGDRSASSWDRAGGWGKLDPNK